jgi:hypothetical protein
MPKQLKQSKRPTEVNQLAHQLVELSTREPGAESEAIPAPPSNLSEYMAAIGRKGGKIGGKSRLKTMTKDRRRRIATKAAKTRWKKVKQSPSGKGQQLSSRARKAFRVIPAVRIRVVTMSRPTLSYFGIINGRAIPAFSSFT